MHFPVRRGSAKLVLLILSLAAPLAYAADAPAPPLGEPAAPAAAVDRDGDPLPPGASLRLGTTRLRNCQYVEAVAFSPDGRIIASCGWDDSVRLWDVATGAPVARLTSKERDGSLGVTFSPDGSLVASVSESGNVRLWNVGSGALLWQEDLRDNVAGFGDRMYGVAFSPDGQLVAAGGVSPAVRVWSVADHKLLYEFDTGTEGGDARPVAFSPDGALLASAGTKGTATIFIWEVASGKTIQKIQSAHNRDVASVHFLNEGRQLISGGIHLERTAESHVKSKSEICIWDVATGDKVAELPTDALDGDVSLALSADRETFYSAHHDRIVTWDLESRLPLRFVRVPAGQIGGRTHALAVSPDGRLLASKGHRARGNKIWLWDLNNNKEAHPQSDAHGAAVIAVRYAPDGSMLATGGTDHAVRLWDAATGEHLRLIDDGSGWARFVEFSPDGKRLYLGRETHGSGQPSFQGEVKAYSIPSGELIAEWHVPDRVMCGAVSADGKWLAVALGLGAMDRDMGPPGEAVEASEKIVVWNTSTNQQAAELDRGDEIPVNLAFTSDGKGLIQLTDNGNLQGWSWRTGESLPDIKVEHQALPPERRSVTQVGNGAVALDAGGRLALYDLKTSNSRWQISITGARLQTAAASPDGKLLAVFLRRNHDSETPSRIMLLNMVSGAKLAKFELTDNWVRALTFAPDGRHVAAGMEFGDIVIWNVEKFFEALK